MKPGYELDKLVAEKIVGLNNKDINARGEEYKMFEYPHISTDLSAAWKCLFPIFGVGFEVRIKWLDRPEANQDEWQVAWGSTSAVGETLPHAICLALLKDKKVI